MDNLVGQWKWETVVPESPVAKLTWRVLGNVLLTARATAFGVATEGIGGASWQGPALCFAVDIGVCDIRISLLSPQRLHIQDQ